jgi:hypothetical protein
MTTTTPATTYILGTKANSKCKVSNFTSKADGGVNFKPSILLPPATNGGGTWGEMIMVERAAKPSKGFEPIRPESAPARVRNSVFFRGFRVKFEL